MKIEKNINITIEIDDENPYLCKEKCNFCSCRVDMCGIRTIVCVLFSENLKKDKRCPGSWRRVNKCLRLFGKT